MRRLSVRGKLYLMILAIFIPMIISQTYETYNLYNKSVEFELETNQDFAEAVSVSFLNYLDRLWDTELSMGMAIIGGTMSDYEEIGSYMKETLRNQPAIKEYCFVEPTSLRILASSNKQAIGVFLTGRQYINSIIGGKDKVVSDVVISRTYNEPTVVVARAIRDGNKLGGIMVATININELNKVLPASRYAEKSFFGLLDKQGVIVYRSGIPNVATNLISVKESSNVVPALGGDVVRVKKYRSAITGKSMTGVNIPIKEINWVAYANTDHNEIVSRTLMNIRGQLIILLFAIFTGLYFSFKIGKRILNPITELKYAALQMSNGNLNVRTNISGTDEIALAAQAFDEMAISIEQYDAMKTEFFSTISHELKTPLNIVLASLQTMESRKLPEVNNENSVFLNKYICMMKQNSYRLLRLIDNLIDITRIDSGSFKFNFDNYNIVSVIEEISLSVAEFSQEKGISLTFDTDSEELLVACDPDKIERIMLNLLSNSIKFTPKGGSIYVGISNNGHKIIISVKDTGIGIPMDKIKIIFDRFRQVDSSLQREYEGSGIGLSLVKALVEAHRGNIYAKSDTGAGTEIIIELPIYIMDTQSEPEKVYMENYKLDKVQRINIEFSDIYK